MVSGQCDNSRIYTQCFGNVLEEGCGSFQKSGHLIPVFKEEWLAGKERLCRNSEYQMQENTGMS